MSRFTDYEQAIEKAFWLLRNTTLTFQQIADFCGLNPLEIAHIENKTYNSQKAGFNPVLYQEITQEDISRCEKDPDDRLPQHNIAEKKRRKTVKAPVAKISKDKTAEKISKKVINKIVIEKKAKTESVIMKKPAVIQKKSTQTITKAKAKSEAVIAGDNLLEATAQYADRIKKTAKIAMQTGDVSKSKNTKTKSVAKKSLMQKKQTDIVLKKIKTQQ